MTSSIPPHSFLTVRENLNKVKDFVVKHPLATANLAFGSVVVLTMSDAALKYGLTTPVLLALVEAIPDIATHYTTAAAQSFPPSKFTSSMVITLNAVRLTQIISKGVSGTSKFPFEINVADSISHTINIFSGMIGYFHSTSSSQKKNQ